MAIGALSYVLFCASACGKALTDGASEIAYSTSVWCSLPASLLAGCPQGEWSTAPARRE